MLWVLVHFFGVVLFMLVGFLLLAPVVCVSLLAVFLLSGLSAS